MDFAGISLILRFLWIVEKLIKVDSILGLLLETLFVLPFALLFLAYLGVNDQQSFSIGLIKNDLFLLGSGIATALPLLWFGIGAQNLQCFIWLASYNIFLQP